MIIQRIQVFAGALPRLGPELTFEEKLLRALRDHVFNKMPIRLLCFTPVGSSLQISLFERGAIYKRIASALEGKIKKHQFHHRMETDEEAITRLINKYASYAILSHTWLRTTAGEVTYSVWNNGLFNPEDLGYKKLVNFCKAAWKHRLIFGWMDTVCINKESSSELDESIRSMYNWYERAAVCVTYLAETEALENMHLDPWFTRGWTLQELLAPRFIKFYNSHWQHLVNHSGNEKWDIGITEQIWLATTISTNELDNIYRAPISRRMQLAAPREVTREEDTAYALMGIFNVSISTAYGEGAERAFLRLLQEIIASSTDALDILNWAGDIPFSHLHGTSAVLPTSPKWYISRSSATNLAPERPIEPLTLSHLGLHVQVLLMPGLSILHTELRRNPIGDYTAIVDISLPRYYRRKIPTTYNLLDNGISGQDGWKNNKGQFFQMSFAVFNFAGSRNIISIPKTCIALVLECDEPAGEVSKSGRFNIIRTEKPVVFALSREIANSDMDYWSWKIQTDELRKHGMQLTSLYL
ncbi:hypothetical protein BJ912DRAFT_644507 [Pholiota molesta]|nr:hypothetical protein BJ912DRAFT_644507 [Pholiota molesta]